MINLVHHTTTTSENVGSRSCTGRQESLYIKEIGSKLNFLAFETSKSIVLVKNGPPVTCSRQYSNGTTRQSYVCN